MRASYQDLSHIKIGGKPKKTDPVKTEHKRISQREAHDREIKQLRCDGAKPLLKLKFN